VFCKIGTNKPLRPASAGHLPYSSYAKVTENRGGDFLKGALHRFELFSHIEFDVAFGEVVDEEPVVPLSLMEVDGNGVFAFASHSAQS
jgi:hypothetical protein